MPSKTVRRFAIFVTPHGYGHAARAAAVMCAVQETLPGAVFEIYSRVPVWFFHMSLRGGFNYHELRSDIGLIQTSATEENLPETIRQLDNFLPFSSELVEELAREVREKGCEAVLCDIAPLGIAVAYAAGLPSILIENFTWDWIYAGYLAEEPRFQPHIDTLRDVFANATYHIRTEPACSFQLPAHLETRVVSRKSRNPAAVTRQRLAIPPQARLVMITMGGILTHLPFLTRLQKEKDFLFLIPGGSQSYEKRGSLVLIPHHSEFYHPDLVEAADAVIGKLGYSTLAEVYAAGVPFGFLPRARFRESAVMGEYAKQTMGALELQEECFFQGDWIRLLPGLLDRPRKRPEGPNGAEQIAAFLEERLNR